jgi:hypothetical protein
VISNTFLLTLFFSKNKTKAPSTCSTLGR